MDQKVHQIAQSGPALGNNDRYCDNLIIRPQKNVLKQNRNEFN